MPVIIEDKKFNKKEPLKINLYKMKIKALQKQYYEYTSNENLENYLNNNIKATKLINQFETLSQMELAKYGTTTYPANLETQSLKNKINFFASIIGLFDQKIDECNHNIHLNQNFENVEIIKENETNKEFLLKMRNKINKDFSERIGNHCPKLIKTTLEKYPSYNHFSNLYQDAIKICSITYGFPADLVSAYNIGYNSFTPNINNIIQLYNELLKELDEYTQINKQKIEKSKKLTKQKN